MQSLFDFKIVNSLPCLNPGNKTFSTATQLPDITTHTASFLKSNALCRKRQINEMEKEMTKCSMSGHYRQYCFSSPLALYFTVRQQKHCLFKPYSMMSTNFEGYSCFLSVLGLAGRELIFFIAALMVLCFGFVSKTVLITYRLGESV